MKQAFQVEAAAFRKNLAPGQSSWCKVNEGKTAQRDPAGLRLGQQNPVGSKEAGFFVQSETMLGQRNSRMN